MIISPAAAQSREVAALSIDDIRITNGAVRYNDERNGAWGRFDGLNAQFSLTAMDQPLTGSGSLVAEGETFEFKSTLTTPQDVADKRQAKLALTVSGMPLTFKHQMAPSGQTTAPDYYRQFALAQRAGALVDDVSPEVGAGEFAFTAQLNASDKSVHLTEVI